MEQNFLDGNTVVTSNTTNTAKKSSRRESKTDTSMKPPSSAISEHSSIKGSPEAIREWLMSLPGDSPANHSPSPGTTLEKMTLGICGLKPSESFAKFDHDTHCWRTSQISLLTNTSEQFSGTWPYQGILQNGFVYQPENWGRPMLEDESGFLPTVQKSDGTFRMIKRPLLLKGKCYRINSNQGVDGNAKMADIAWNLWGGPLNPTYTEAMMLWPLEWTALKPLEMDKFQQWLKRFGD